MPNLTSGSLVSSDTVYGGNGNTVLGVHYGNEAGAINRTAYIIATTYSGNPAYLRDIKSISAGTEFDTNQYIKTKNIKIWCIRY